MPTTIYKRRLPIPQEIREEMPLSPELVEAKKAFDAQVADVISGDSNKKLLPYMIKRGIKIKKKELAEKFKK